MKRKTKRARSPKNGISEAPLPPALRNRVLTDAMEGIEAELRIVIDLANLTDEPNKDLLATMRRALHALLLRHHTNLAYVERQLKAILDRETVAPAPGYFGSDELKLVML